MRKSRFALLIVVTGLALIACDDSSRVSTAQTSVTGGTGDPDPVGVWEIRYQDAVGQDYLDVLVMRSDGTYDSYSTRSDSGHYQYNDRILSFVSGIGPQLSGSFPVTFGSDDTMALYWSVAEVNANQPFALWRRSDLSAVFETVRVNGATVPKGLPGLLRAAMDHLRLPMERVAWPTSLDITRDASGHLKIRIDFYSATTDEGLRLLIDEYHVESTVIDGTRMNKNPLPADFVDIPQILLATQSNFGTLQRASLRTYQGAGPVWMISGDGPVGSTFSAVTGERIEGDVTGYIAQYEADWTRLGEIWAQVIRQNTPRSEEESEWLKQLKSNPAEEACRGRTDAYWSFGRCNVYVSR